MRRLTSDADPLDRRTLVLAGIGLLVAGLLAGVLATLWLRPGSAPAAIPVRPLAQPIALDDSGAQALDPATLAARFRAVSEQARSAVVFIQIEPRGPIEQWLRRFGGGDPRSPAIEQVTIGSGVIMSPEGYIVTNDHVVQDAGRITVTLPDRRQFTADVVGVDRSTDLAVLKISGGADLPVLPVGNSDAVQVGDWVLAVGSPFGLTSTVTAGIVSALGCEGVIRDEAPIEDFIQTDAAINPGNSGGALVNLRGELVGVLTAIATENGAYQGYGFAVPSNLVTRVTEDLIERGEVQRGVIGVGIARVTPRIAERLELPGTVGVLLTEVPEGGPAHRAGLRQYDVVTHVGGREVNAPNQLQSAVARYRPGQVVTLAVQRGPQRRTVRVPLSVLRPPPDPDLSEIETPPHTDVPLVVPEGAYGVGFRDLTRADRESFGVREGAYVARVQEGTPAAFAGVPVDVVVVGIEEQPVASAEAAAEMLDLAEPGTPLLLRVKRRDGTTAFYEVVIED
ncbi:MAG TPA: trypsin-like peptidase domain-containing protein [Rhodothermales bacterium]|nr:trypsin-like peptidase domain-containing protein [Rhodothermales bacterium]